MMLQERTEPRGWFWTFPCFTTVLGLSVPLNSLVKLSTWENTCLARSWNKNPVPGFSWVILETFPYEQKSLGVQGEHTLGKLELLVLTFPVDIMSSLFWKVHFHRPQFLWCPHPFLTVTLTTLFSNVNKRMPEVKHTREMRNRLQFATENTN